MGIPHLAELTVENVAVVERVRVELAPGFVAFTGETGVGKSILVDALRLLTGARANAGLIRTGCDRAVVEGVFRHVPDRVLDMLTAAGVLEDARDHQPEMDSLVIRRVLSRDGNNAVYINDRRAGLALLAQVGGELVDIQGQHAQRSLLSEVTHRELLDSVAGLTGATAAYREGYGKVQALTARIRELESGRQEAEARAGFLSFAVREIREAAPEPAEDEELIRELARLSDAERLKGLADSVYDTLRGADGAVLSRLAAAGEAVAELAAVSPEQAETEKMMADAALLLEEAADCARRFRDETRPDPVRLAEVEARLAALEQLKRKYGRTIGDILATADVYEVELAESGDVAGSLDRLAGEREEGIHELAALAGHVSQGREETGKRLTGSVHERLSALAMPHARMEVILEPEPAGADAIVHGGRVLGPAGAERVRFRLAANPGEEARPLGKVASGGELSRIMLAIKTVLIDADPVPCLVFDEVDAGIGGAVADQVGHLLSGLSRRHQVFCVTHLPQVAARAGQHVSVAKGVDGARTRTSVTRLEGEERVGELARMLGGASITDTTLAHAREMLAAG